MVWVSCNALEASNAHRAFSLSSVNVLKIDIEYISKGSLEVNCALLTLRAMS